MSPARCCIRSSICRLPASPLSASDVIGLLYALQFLIHSTFCTCSLNYIVYILRFSVCIAVNDTGLYTLCLKKRDPDIIDCNFKKD